MRRAVTEEGKDWDKLVPYVLFAYREVPQASTGFSPFELLYGRPVRGPLDILRESWEASKHSSESIVSYVLSIQEKLVKMSALAQENLAKAQVQQKRWYDRNARERAFQPGEHVLVLLPTSTHKLLAKWQGPYPVKRRISSVTYEVDMFDKQKCRRIFHINMLRKWHAPTALNLWAEEETEPLEDSELPLWREDPSESESMPTISERLSSSQKEQLRQLREEFADVMRDQPGRTTLAEHQIETGSARPVRLPPYRLPHAYRESVKKELKEMQEQGIIEPSTSEWASPVVLVKKKDGALRLCVDYRKLNGASLSDAYPMPRIDELIDRLGHARYITTLDLTRGYWQVPLAESAKSKTAFATPFGLFQFNVMPFGLQGAPATFQRMMDRMIRGMEEFAASYIDDLVVYSRTWEEHLSHIRQVLQRLRDAGLTAKARKCQFGMEQCLYLGHLVGSGTIRPEPSKVEAISTFTTPRTKREVRTFLGLAGYYRKFIPDFATIAAPLTDLTRKNAPNLVSWSPACDSAFTELKGRMCSSPVLRSPDFTKPFLVQTDAYERGVGAVLSQLDDDGNDYPVSYYSRKLLPREERYATQSV